MTVLAKRLILAYVLLTLALAALGAHGQTRYRHHAELLRAKEAAQIAVAGRRAEAAAVNGPLAVTGWARAAGMIPAPEALDVIQVAPSPVAAPSSRSAPAYVEVRTEWR